MRKNLGQMTKMDKKHKLGRIGRLIGTMLSEDSFSVRINLKRAKTGSMKLTELA